MARSIYLVAGQSNAALLATAAGSAARAGGGLVPVAGVYAGGAPLTFASARPDWFQPGELAGQLIASLRAALLADPSARLSGILWIQGEADTYGNGRPQEYGARLGLLVDRIAAGLADLGERASGFGFVVAALSAQAPAAENRPAWQTIRDQQLALDHPRITVIDPDATGSPPGGLMFMADGLHYQPGMRQQLQRRMTDELARTVEGGTAADRITGRNAADWISGGGGDDALAGGGGNDQVFGDTGNDALWGQDGNDRLLGLAGQDRIHGGAGNDRLAGGRGTDTLWGGDGADVFVFGVDGPTFAQPGGHDVIADFVPGRDRIDLSAIDADLRQGTDDAFRFRGSAGFSGQPGELRSQRDGGDILLIADRNGDGLGDYVLRVMGIAAIPGADLIL